MSQSKSPNPLDDAYLRLAQARRRLDELRQAEAGYIDSEHEELAKSISVALIPAPARLRVQFKTRDDLPVPASLSIQIGEVVHHLRAVLDYLVNRLAELDSGSEQKKVQFPLDDAAEKFPNSRKSALRGVNDWHAAAIEQLQPYNGVKWAGWLREMSNEDKHRNLIVVERQGGARARLGDRPMRPEDSAAEEGIFVTVTMGNNETGEPLYAQAQVLLSVALKGGLPVVETLAQIADGVAAVLDQFAPEFK